MSAQFVPLLSPVATSNDSGASHDLNVFPRSAAKSVFKPLIPPPVHTTEECAKPTITLERKGDVISGIRIQCGCGSVIELSCLH
ncbi:MAG TPA: hypothetical protein VGO67_23915 [Verrucomicrobiae bacterium]|jgi:hypothetical protein